MYGYTARFIALLVFTSGPRAFAQTSTTLSYDEKYDNVTTPLSTVACSDNLKNRNYTTFGSLPTFPNISAVYTVEGGNSSNCGACYAVTYGSNTVDILAVDQATTGFVVSKEAMDSLTNYEAAKLGTVNVTFAQVDASNCGIY